MWPTWNPNIYIRKERKFQPTAYQTALSATNLAFLSSSLLWLPLDSQLGERGVLLIVAAKLFLLLNCG
jgi:hypothetical protein